MKRILIIGIEILGLIVPVAGQRYSMLPNPDAKSLAMGGVEMAITATNHPLYGNASSVLFYNPAKQLSASYVNEGRYSYYAASGYAIFASNNALQLGWRQLRRSDQRDMAIDANYARRFGQHWAVGLTARYYRYSHPEKIENALAADLSAMYSTPVQVCESATLRAGLRVSNIGASLGDSSTALPVNFMAGTALDFFITDAHELTFGVDCGYYAKTGYTQGPRASLGVEYNLMQLVQFRGGFHIGDNTAQNPTYGSIGAGVRFMHLRLDFAYLFAQRKTLLHNKYSISFGLDL
ncbi:MAG: PorV/PorQ family protein [Alistipes sp.]